MASANSIQHGGNHYRHRTGGVQHWDLMAEYDVPYLEGNASKYGYRWPRKNGLEDILKFEHYVQKILELHRHIGYLNCSQMQESIWREFCREHDLDAVSTQTTLLALTWKNEAQLLECLDLIGKMRQVHYPE